jgi:gamma-glutamyl:cysteine ligase YbdK (ATP-grasp superfamily)
VVNDQLEAMPIVDKVLKDFHGRVVNLVQQRQFTFGKELQLHVLEVKPNEPFESPQAFEEKMQEAVLTLSDFLMRKYGARLLGTGMHPFLRLEQTGVWPHRHRQIYEAYSRVFNLKRHGWLNIQSFQLNLPYSDEQSGVKLHNVLANVCAYLPAVAASSPLYEGRFGRDADNRLDFYRLNQREVPSVTGDVVPEYVSSFKEYHERIIEKYSSDMARAGAGALILHKDWVNSRGVIFRFDRKAVEIRVMDEQECVKSDVALSCFIRALTRGLLEEETELQPHEVLVRDFDATVKDGLKAATLHPSGRTAREVCRGLLKNAWKYASDEEKKHLPLIEKRVEAGNLSELIRKEVEKKSQRTDFREAILHVYSKLIRSLLSNQPFL